MSMHNLNVVGYVGQSAEVKHLDNGRKVINFSLVVNEDYKDKNGVKHERATFYNCSKFLGKDSSTKVSQHILKGGIVAVSGIPRPKAYTSKKGELRIDNSIEVKEISLVSGPRSSDSKSETYKEKEQAFEEEYE